jgi:uncharacterized protein YdhG (YjbR/CyaY superfamily)
MAELKTKKTAASVKDFLNGIAGEQQRADAFAVAKMMEEVTGEKPRMWGPSIVGFGDYHYKYASGQEGDTFLVGFSPRKNALTLYLLCMHHFGDNLKKLGNYKAGKGCLYVKKLADIDVAVLGDLIKCHIKALHEIYSENAKAAAAKKKTAKKKL